MLPSSGKICEFKAFPAAQVDCTLIPCLVLVRRFPNPSRSIHFGDVSEAFRLDHVTQNALAARKRGLGTRQTHTQARLGTLKNQDPDDHT